MKARRCILFVVLLLVFSVLSPAWTDGTRIQGKINVKLAPKAPEGTVLTIQSETGEVIDCVDIYKQPAFKHPKLKNHIIQMKPSTYPSRMVQRSSETLELDLTTQSWDKNGRCPNGSIPIRRPRHKNGTHGIKKRSKMNSSILSADGYIHQYAVVHYLASNNEVFHGAHAMLNIWSPSVEAPDDFSLTQIWLVADSAQGLNTIEAGWQVGNSRGLKPRFFIYWTSDDYQHTGCYDLDCPGFVQTNEEFSFGSPLPVSTYQEKQSEMEIHINKDKETGNWWLYLQGKEIGYWPSTLFTSLANGATIIDWGGEIAFRTSPGKNTSSTQMGSGRFPNEGLGKSSYVRGILYKTAAGGEHEVNPASLLHDVTVPSCYDMTLDNISSQVYLFYGGPGCK